MKTFGLLIFATFFNVEAVLAQTKGEKKRPAQEVVATAVMDGKKLTTKDPEAIQAAIAGELFERFVKENKIEATEEEITEFIAASRKAEGDESIESAQERTALESALASPHLTKAEKTEIRSRLKRNAGMAKDIRETKAAAKKEQGRIERMEREMASQMIIPWKMNVALLEKYGGRVIFQQFGLEPVDAYRDFLREHEKKGTFQILDEKVAKEFWKYFTDETMHTFLGEGAEAAQMLKTPWWKAAAAPGNANAESPWFLLELGHKKRSAGQHDAAIDLYTRAIAIAPNDASAYNFRAFSHSGKGDSESTLKDYRRAVELDPKDATYRVNLANELHRLKKDDEAGKLYDEAVAAEPDDSHALMNRGEFTFKQGKYEAAAADFREAAKHSGRFNVYYGNIPEKAVLLRMLGDALMKTKDFEGAKKAYDEAIENTRQFPDAWLGRAAAKEALHDDAGAEQDRKTARTLKPPSKP